MRPFYTTDNGMSIKHCTKQLATIRSVSRHALENCCFGRRCAGELYVMRLKHRFSWSTHANTRTRTMDGVDRLAELGRIQLSVHLARRLARQPIKPDGDRTMAHSTSQSTLTGCEIDGSIWVRGDDWIHQDIQSIYDALTTSSEYIVSMLTARYSYSFQGTTTRNNAMHAEHAIGCFLTWRLHSRVPGDGRYSLFKTPCP